MTRNGTWADGDADIMYVLHDDERKNYRDNQRPTKILDKVARALVDKYRRANVKPQRRAVSVKFPATDGGERVVSFDVARAFAKGGHYEIRDKSTAQGWTETNPRMPAKTCFHFYKQYGNRNSRSSEYAIPPAGVRHRAGLLHFITQIF
jgi:hypothetical protein